MYTAVDHHSFETASKWLYGMLVWLGMRDIMRWALIVCLIDYGILRFYGED